MTQDLQVFYAKRLANVVYVVDSDTPGPESSSELFQKAVAAANQVYLDWGLRDEPASEESLGHAGWQFHLVGGTYVDDHLHELGDNHQIVVVGTSRGRMLKVARRQLDRGFIKDIATTVKIPPRGGFKGRTVPAWKDDGPRMGTSMLPAELRKWGGADRPTTSEGPVQNVGAVYDCHAGRFKRLAMLAFNLHGHGKAYLPATSTPPAYHFTVALGILHETGHTLIADSIDSSMDNHNGWYGQVMSWVYSKHMLLKDTWDPGADPQQQEANGRKVFDYITDASKNEIYIKDVKARRYTPRPPRIQLIRIKAIDTDDMLGDHVIIKIGGEQVWGPVKITDDWTKDLDDVEPIEFHQDVNIELFDEEWFKKDDNLGSWKAEQESRLGQAVQATFKTKSSMYVLTYKVI